MLREKNICLDYFKEQNIFDGRFRNASDIIVRLSPDETIGPLNPEKDLNFTSTLNCSSSTAVQKHSALPHLSEVRSLAPAFAKYLQSMQAHSLERQIEWCPSATCVLDKDGHADATNAK